MPTARLTELQAVNSMLRSVGEAPIASFGVGAVEAEVARDVLEETSRLVQIDGWHVNTQFGLELIPNAANNIEVPHNVLSLKTTGAQSHLDLKVVYDGASYLLENNQTHSREFTQNVNVDLIYFLEFEELTPALQSYITTLAGHKYQQGALSSQILYEFTSENVAYAMQIAMSEESNTAVHNVLSQSGHVYMGTHRANPRWGW